MKHTWLAVLVAATLLTGLTLWLTPSERPGDGRSPALPWEIEVDGLGGSRVFGLSLGLTTLAEAERQLGIEAKVTLFRPEGGEPVVEAFFDDLRPAGLKADFVLVLDLPAGRIAAMHERGLRTAQGRDGVRRVSIAPSDLPDVRAAPISAITYLPAINLDPEVLEKRFGVPARRVPEGPGTRHWLYPEMGLDIVVNEDGKEVLQYVAPRDFERLATPLRDAGN
ncbi:MAG: hypothetical protein GWP66_02455 [Gammaproteobacteria bacterium]|jgi:hypothetical protein|nr:hypothetical protein [Gammaproteobacteria bacterium]